MSYVASANLWKLSKMRLSCALNEDNHFWGLNEIMHEKYPDSHWNGSPINGNYYYSDWPNIFHDFMVFGTEAQDTMDIKN